MEVHITFVGLCLFVPDKDGKRVHVLLPKTSGHHKHYPQIMYPGLQAAANVLNRVYLDLTPLHSGGSVQPLEKLLDVQAVVGKPVPSEVPDNDPKEKLALRVTLPLADYVVPGEIALWEVKKADGKVDEQLLTHQLTWVIRSGEICDVAWELKPLSTSRSGAKTLGRPIPDPDGVVRIHVLHLPEKPVIVEPGKEAHHAEEFYKVTGYKGEKPKLAKGPTPICPEKLDLGVQGKADDRAEAAYNCMLAKSGAG